MKKILLYLIISYSSLITAQYNPEIFSNLYTGGSQFNGISNLRYSTKLNNQLFFNLQNQNSYDLYVTDGTVANTRLLKTVTQVLNLVTFDNHVYFSFKDNTNGVEIWKTDGTLSGTTRISILGGNAIAAHDYMVAGNKLFFASANAATPFVNHLYSIEPGSSVPVLLNANLNDVGGIQKYNDKVLFYGTEIANSSSTTELYISDGTQAGTYLLKDIKPGAAGSNPKSFIPFQNKLYFSADDGTNGREIWVTDGTTAGTTLLKDINPGLGNSFVRLIAGIFNGKMYFSANGALWSTDGTVNGTTLFMNVDPGSGDNFVTLNNKLVFLADDGIHGYEIWTSDGTPQNTALLLDINQGANSSLYELLQSNAICTNQLFFNADNQSSDIEPWVTDGTVAGTHLVEDINTINGSVDYETRYELLNGNIYFTANPGNGRQLYKMESCSNLGVENILVNTFKIYPNSTKDIINIETTAEITKVEIYNTLGQLVNTISENKKQIDLSALNSGIYLLTITTTDNQRSVQRFLKE